MMIATANSNGRTILAIRLRQLGDVIATLGTLRAIKQASPASRVLFMVDRAYHGLLRNVAFVDALVPEPPKLRGLQGVQEFNRYIDDLRAMAIDCVLDFHSNTRSALVSYLTGAPTRIGFDVRGRKVFYTDVEPRAVFHNGRKTPRTSHESALSLSRRAGVGELAGSVAGTLPLAPDEPRRGREQLLTAGAPRAALEQGKVVGVNPGLPYPAKDWGEPYFVELARRLAAGGRTVVVLWGPGEEDRARRIARAAGAGALLAPRLDLGELPGVLKNLGVVVTIDSGLKHLAVAVGIPTITLFGPTNPYEWHMGGENDRYLFAALSCSPCRLLECPFGSPCMRRLTPDRVDREISELEKSVDMR